ncbi:uncharacterized protein LOC117811213 isoform X1 [Notolabrus celidotus]|uniref:uncharacterized protein LOC117811213 isoform X1 n=1 Tax=Notolabrus celidotus TaxID=1203425 RepID=UPI0014906416|nr:uncharacterized protein LOC117811213 isoform X1 [Notolabrus celidotus]
MKDGITAGENSEVSRLEVFEDYVKCFLQVCTEVGPCREDRLLEKAAQYLLTEPELRGIFTHFPFYQSVEEGCRASGEDCRRFLSAVIKATELLETLCVNIVLQPWKKEIKTLKTFTGPFVYGLLPVFSSSTIQSILASIGYLPHADTPVSEYRLCEEVDPDRVKLVGFELLLARVECCHLLELHDQHQAGQQTWLEVLHERLGSTELEESTDEKTVGRKEEEEERKNEEAGGKEVPLRLESRIGVKPKPKPKPRHCSLNNEDRSFMEMQINYPDLVFRGRPLLPDKPNRAKSSRSSCKASINITPDESKAAELPTGDPVEDIEASSTTTCSKSEVSQPDESCVDDVTCSGSNNRDCGGTAATGDTVTGSLSNAGEGRVDDEHEHRRAISLHITMRAGSTAGQSLTAGQPQPAAEPPQQQTAAGDNQGSPSLSSADLKDIRELEERMGQLDLQETKEEERRKQDDMSGGKKINKERRRVKVRKARTDVKAGERSLRIPVTETGPAPSQSAGRLTTPSESDPAVMKQQGGDTESADTGRGEEEQLSQSYVLVEHHKKEHASLV